MARHLIVSEDCQRALAHTRDLWPQVAGRRLFITGGSGFFGSWFLELLTWAADTLGFDYEAVVLTREPEAFRRGSAGHLATHRGVRLLAGDVQSFSAPAGKFDYVVHFGSTGTKEFHDRAPLEFYDLIVNGTRRVLDLAGQAGATRVLVASTGAIYGNLPPLQGEGVSESHGGAPDPLSPASANAEAKRAAEFASAVFAGRHPSVSVSVARGFAFIGPYLPASAGFAAYDFIQDARAGRPIVIKGDGTPLRSYLYGSDLAVWLWTLLLRAPAGVRAWNVGSDEVCTVRELAEKIAACAAESVPVRVLGRTVAGAAAHTYVPSVRRARSELGLVQRVGLEEAVRRTYAWTAPAS